jgi:plastocyanin
VIALLAAMGVVLPASASALVVHGAHGRLVGLTLRRGISPRSVAGSVASAQPQPAPTDTGALTYHGGPVLHSSAPYLVFWDPAGAIPVSSERLMERYLTGLAADSAGNDDALGVIRQYTDGAGFAGARQTFGPGQAIADPQPYPGSGCTVAGYPTCLTDAQIQLELERVISQQGLPTDGPAGDGVLPPAAPVYFVVLPANVDVCDPGLGGAGQSYCADRYFCSYHSSLTDAGDTVLYATMPMLLATTSPKSCQSDNTSAVQEPNGDPADIVINDLGHEASETTTDPLGSGWWDPVSGDEVADGCSSYGASPDPAADQNPDAFSPTLGGQASAGTLYDQLIAGEEYYTQSEWSNGDAQCRMAPSSGVISPAFTTPASPVSPGTAVTFDPAASASTNPLSSHTWNFGDGTGAFGIGPAARVSHTYQAAGTYTVSLTLVDDRGNLQTSTQTLTVGAPAAAATVTASPTTPSAFAASSITASPPSSPVLAASGSTATFSRSLRVLRGARITRVSVLRRRGASILAVTLSGPGILLVGARRLSVARAETLRVRLPTPPRARRQVQPRGRLAAALLIRFFPRIGAPSRARIALSAPPR